MRSLQEIIRDTEALSIEEKALVVDSMLRSMDVPDPGVERKWIDEVRRRREEWRTGKVIAIPAHEVFTEIRERLKK